MQGMLYPSTSHGPITCVIHCFQHIEYRQGLSHRRSRFHSFTLNTTWSHVTRRVSVNNSNILTPSSRPYRRDRAIDHRLRRCLTSSLDEGDFYRPNRPPICLPRGSTSTEISPTSKIRRTDRSPGSIYTSPVPRLPPLFFSIHKLSVGSLLPEGFMPLRNGVDSFRL
jgi:hypothetical protein